MSLSSFPKECFDNVLSFLGDSTLYNCLFINRYLCRLSVPIIWRDPFRFYMKPRTSLISTLLARLDEEELVYRSINYHNQTPLFEYEKFIKIIRHEYCIKNITDWLNLLKKKRKMKTKNRITMNEGLLFNMRIQKLVDVVYRLIMRQDSNIQELIFSYPYHCLPKISIFTTYKTSIANLRSLSVGIDMTNDYIELLNMLSKCCNEIVMLNIFMTPYLKSKNIKEITLFKKKWHLKVLKLWSDDESVGDYKYGYVQLFLSNVVETMINSLCGEELLKLSLNVITPETIRAVKESCPNINHLEIKIYSRQEVLRSIIQLICELSSLKILKFKINPDYYIDSGLLFESLGDYLTSVECLLLDICLDDIYLRSFEYFVNNCKANLKNLAIWFFFDYGWSKCVEWLKCVDNFQKIHNSLKLLGIRDFKNEFKEIEIITSLKNQGIDVVLWNDSFESSMLEEKLYNQFL